MTTGRTARQATARRDTVRIDCNSCAVLLLANWLRCWGLLLCVLPSRAPVLPTHHGHFVSCGSCRRRGSSDVFGPRSTTGLLSRHCAAIGRWGAHPTPPTVCPLPAPHRAGTCDTVTIFLFSAPALGLPSVASVSNSSICGCFRNSIFSHHHNAIIFFLLSCCR